MISEIVVVTIVIAQVALLALVIALWYSVRSRERVTAQLAAAGLATREAAEGRVQRDNPAVTRALAGARSPFWWRRLGAARTLSSIAEKRDRDTILGLLTDPHPAVQTAATSSLGRYADAELLVRVIDGLSSASSAVRTFQLGVLAQHAERAAPMLRDRIRSDAPPHKLYAYIHAAAALNDPECLARAAGLSTHPHPEVRLAVARVVRSQPGDAMHIKLLVLLRDSDWRVRAQAARGLGRVPDDRTIHELSRALTDQNWWVRFRAALALANLGDAGRAALAAAREQPDRYARDMAVLVGGLSESSIAELSAA